MSRSRLWLAGAVLALALAHALVGAPGEPFYNNDENRHVMTGVFFRDLLLDRPFDDPRGYALDYYLQYPALGLTVWPPLFHGIEGVFMLVFGTSYAVARAVVALFAVLACVYLFLLVRRTHDAFAAVLAVLLCGLAPLVFQLSRHVMLEIPSLAFTLAAVYHFVRYLDAGKPLDVYLAAVASALLALTRYDAFFLLLFFALAVVARRRFDLFRRREVWLAALLALAIVVPVYVPLLAAFGPAHLRVSVEGGAAGRTFWEHLVFYPWSLLRRIGPLTAVFAALGLLAALRPSPGRVRWPYFVLAAATYAAFTPLAELEERHAIYWYPAFALFAVEGIDWLAARLKAPAARPVLTALAAAGAFWTALAGHNLYLRGYEEAARYVVENTRASRFTFMDGFLNGDFIYQVRRHDPGRRLWVLRGDKMLYGVLNEPGTGYAEYAAGDREILDVLHRYDPELIVVEEPQVYFRIPVADRLRAVLAAHPERFERVKSFPIDSNVPFFQGVRLDVYRSRIRNPRPERRVSFDMISLGRSLTSEVK
ncbi:MAG TPA: glycosyltransferase family 39 protein [Thermoanaerobaculia bacterium]